MRSTEPTSTTTATAQPSHDSSSTNRARAVKDDPFQLNGPELDVARAVLRQLASALEADDPTFYSMIERTARTICGSDVEIRRRVAWILEAAAREVAAEAID